MKNAKYSENNDFSYLHDYPFSIVTQTNLSI